MKPGIKILAATAVACLFAACDMPTSYSKETDQGRGEIPIVRDPIDTLLVGSWFLADSGETYNERYWISLNLDGSGSKIDTLTDLEGVQYHKTIFKWSTPSSILKIQASDCYEFIDSSWLITTDPAKCASSYEGTYHIQGDSLRLDDESYYIKQ